MEFKLLENKEKSPAPALEKGIRVLTRLTDCGPQNLETISKELSEPKASILRYLDTLISLDLIERDPVSKEYSSKIAIIRRDDSDRNLYGKVQHLLNSLVEKTFRTAEWYVFDKNRMLLTQRAEPRDAFIRVIAQIGFERKIDKEFEAVTRIAILNLGIKINNQKFWIYKNGTREYLSKDACNEILQKDMKNGYALDLDYNCNGVRRYAAPKFDNGKFAGVVALAENFTPDADQQVQNISKILKTEINRQN